jgi:hypothetical protein
MKRVFVLLMLCVTATVAQESPLPKVGSLHVPSLTFTRAPLPSVLARMLSAAGTSGGVALVEKSCSTPEVSVALGEGTLASALDVLTRSLPNYGWTVRNNIINVLPRNGEILLLNTSVSSFAWKTSDSLAEVLARLRAAPEIAKRARELGLYEAPFSHASGTMCIKDCEVQGTTPPATRSFRDTTVVDLLNLYAFEHPGTVWLYSERQCGSERSFVLQPLAQ